MISIYMALNNPSTTRGTIELPMDFMNLYYHLLKGMIKL